MKSYFHFLGNQRHASRGVALIIVLSFIVILSVLILAFLTRAITDEKITTSSANQTKVSLFTKGAVDSIVADLQQEIVDGSMHDTPGGSSVYYPNAPATVPPSIAVPASIMTGNYPAAANLLKMSTAGIPFHPGGANYSAVGVALASNIPTTAASYNGRSISLARWNKALLLPKANPNSTDVTPAAVDFTAPDWILVARDGSNPTSWNANMETTPATKSTLTPVIGRYAYVIYNEGGLLDANAAGYPDSPTGSAVLTTAQKGYKPSEALADLTQIGLTAAQIKNLVGWRNNATAQYDTVKGTSTPLSGGFLTGYGWSTLTGTTYLHNILGNGVGFLRNASPRLTANGQSDQKFATRQELIDFFNNGLSLSSTDQASLQNDLQYLATFTRDLDQPSIVPPISTHFQLSPPTPLVMVPGPDVNHPQGNDIVDPTPSMTSPSSDSKPAWQLINPDFLGVRVMQSFVRNDGSKAVVGEPLVKKRFALDRLAWLTPEGPSANLSTGDTFYQNLNVTQGFSDAFLKQGTAANIQKYFGLVWLGGSTPALGPRWIYAPESTDSTTVAQETSIKRLSDVATAGKREPNFIELLKASILASSVGLATYSTDENDNVTYPGNSGGSTVEQFPYSGNALQASEDRKVDPQIIQIAANIIAQTGLGDYPFQIDFAGGGTEYIWGRAWHPNIPGSLPPEVGATYSGVKNLPGLYRMYFVSVPKTTGATPTFAYLAQPELWNPGWYSSGQATSTANMPTQFRVAAMQYDVGANMVSANQDPANKVASQRGTFDANSYITFSLPPASDYTGYFRVPTLLDQPSDPAKPTPASSVDQVTDAKTNLKHVGFWFGDSAIDSTVTYTPPKTMPPGGMSLIAGTSSSVAFFSLEALVGGQWVRYDTLALRTATNAYTSSGGDLEAQPPYSASPNTWDRCDPRTDRFGLIGSNLALTGLAGSNIYHPSDWTSLTTGRKQRATFGDPDSYLFAQNWGSGPFIRSLAYWGINKPISGYAFYADPDDVVRGATAFYATTGNTIPLDCNYPDISSSSGPSNSRPYILHRQFKSVAELGYVFKGTPWKNLDFSEPESGDSALLDLFCIQDSSASDGLVAGRVDLNTRQPKVLAALINGAIVDESKASYLTSTLSLDLAQMLVNRTTDTNVTDSTSAPLANRSELVGRYQNPPSTSTAAGSAFLPTSPTYTGFSGDVASASSGQHPGGYSIGSSQIRRIMEAVERALGDSGTTRTWNLLIDVVAQTGRYPAAATGADQFIVEGERRYWVHLSIDRMTGTIIDESWEPVSE